MYTVHPLSVLFLIETKVLRNKKFLLIKYFSYNAYQTVRSRHGGETPWFRQKLPLHLCDL